MSRPLAIDLFCGAGGAGMGLHRAGFDVIGVDLRPQPRYPFSFVQADALAPPLELSRAAFIWASPVCKGYSVASAGQRAAGVEYPDQVAAVRALLAPLGIPFAIENVPGAPLRPDLRLTGQMFGLRVLRERIFELHGFWTMEPPVDRPAPGCVARGEIVTVAGHLWQKTANRKASIAEARAAMGIDWMTAMEIAQAIPPAYGEFIGRAALRWIEAGKAAA